MLTPKTRTHIKNIEEGLYTTQKQQVYNLIKEGHNTFEKLTFFLGPNTSIWGGRLSDLEELGLIKKIDKGGRYSFFEIVTNPDEQKKTRKNYRIKVYNKWIKKAPYFLEINPRLCEIILELKPK